MAGRGKSTAGPRGTKTGRTAVGRKREPLYVSGNTDDDPYRDLRIPEDEQNEPGSDEYIWPDFEDDDEDRV